MVALTSQHGVKRDTLALALHEDWVAWHDDEAGDVRLMRALLGATSDAHDAEAASVALDIPAQDVFLPLIPYVQHCLGAAQHKADLERYTVLLDQIADDTERTVSKARHLSQCSPGAMAFAACPPSLDDDFTMQHYLLREACRRALGLVRPVTPGCKCPSCPTVDNTEEHARRCARTGLLSIRHHMVCRSVAAGLRQMGFTGVQSEDYSPFAAGPDPDKHVDLCIPGGQGFAFNPTHDANADAAALAVKGIMLDFSITDPTGIQLRARASGEAGYAAERRAKEKHDTYHPGVFPADRYTLVPLVFELFGRACDETHSFIHAVAKYKEDRAGGTWRKGAIVDWWRRRISIALQSAVSAAVDTALSRSRPRGDFAAFARVHILRPIALTQSTADTAATLVRHTDRT
jgi:hypothetical protein